jgi:hypothetical protein
VVDARHPMLATLTSSNARPGFLRYRLMPASLLQMGSPGMKLDDPGSVTHWPGCYIARP